MFCSLLLIWTIDDDEWHSYKRAMELTACTFHNQVGHNSDDSKCQIVKDTLIILDITPILKSFNITPTGLVS